MRTPFRRSRSGLGDLFGLAAGGASALERDAYRDTQKVLGTIALNQARAGKVASETALNEAQREYQRSSLGDDMVAAQAEYLGIDPLVYRSRLYEGYGSGSNVQQMGARGETDADIVRRNRASEMFPEDPLGARFEAALAGRKVDQPYGTSGGVVLNRETGEATDLRPYTAAGGTLVHRGTGAATAAPRTYAPSSTTPRGTFIPPSAFENIFTTTDDFGEAAFDQGAFSEYAIWAERNGLNMNQWDTLQKWQVAKAGGAPAPAAPGVQTPTDAARIDPSGRDPLGILGQ